MSESNTPGSEPEVISFLKAMTADLIRRPQDYNKAVLILLNDEGDTYNRGIAVTGMSQVEVVGLLEFVKHDVIADPAGSDDDNGEDWQGMLKNFGIPPPQH